MIKQKNVINNSAMVFLWSIVRPFYPTSVGTAGNAQRAISERNERCEITVFDHTIRTGTWRNAKGPPLSRRPLVKTSVSDQCATCTAKVFTSSLLRRVRWYMPVGMLLTFNCPRVPVNWPFCTMRPCRSVRV